VLWDATWREQQQKSLTNPISLSQIQFDVDILI
jgi:hypothetical protein